MKSNSTTQKPKIKEGHLDFSKTRPQEMNGHLNTTQTIGLVQEKQVNILFIM